MSHAWMPLYVDDYLADTGHLTALEHGAYMLMIMHYWQKGGLPTDERMIARVARLNADQWAESRDVLAMLFEDGWKHKRIEEELAKASEIIGKRKAAATAMHARRNASAEQVQSKCSDTRVPPSPSPREEEVANATSSPEPAKAAPVGVIGLPTVSEGDFQIFETDIAEWEPAFPAVNVRQQLASMRQWLIANPTKRKTRRGMRKFVVGWLDRKQNEAGAVIARGGAPPPKRTYSDVMADRVGAEDGSEGIFGSRGNVERLPTRLIESRPDDENFRGGIAGRIVRSGH
jgi:uncharacterized protein YdaU (DUF1376 family)